METVQFCKVEHSTIVFTVRVNALCKILVYVCVCALSPHNFRSLALRNIRAAQRCRHIGTWCLEAAERCCYGKLVKLLEAGRQAGANEAAWQERWNMYWIGVSKLLEDTHYQEKLQMCI